jgi:hypothetical protein
MTTKQLEELAAISNEVVKTKTIIQNSSCKSLAIYSADGCTRVDFFAERISDDTPAGVLNQQYYEKLFTLLSDSRNDLKKLADEIVKPQ